MTWAYPLQWPDNWPRTSQRELSRFDTPIWKARDQLLRELDLFGATDVVVTSNMVLGKSGVPLTRQPYSITDPGVAVYFTLQNGEEACIPCDRWTFVDDNLQAVNRTVQALRGLERWGAKEMVDAAFRGFAALPEMSNGYTGDWWVTLGVERDAPRTAIDRAYRKLVLQTHPDQGGDPERFRVIQAAYERARV